MTMVLPALVAITVAIPFALILLVPYVTLQYRRRGTLGITQVATALGLLVYPLALAAYVILPYPAITPDFCARYGVDPQLRPFQFISDIIRERVTGPASLLRNPALLGVTFNIMLFVPLGAFFGYLTRRGVLITTLIGALTSLFIEVTQLTGVWSLFPCAYRFFDVDDLLTNTAGAFLGAAIGTPLLSHWRGRSDDRPVELPRPLTVWRRWLGMACDLAAIILIGGALTAFYYFLTSVIDLLPDLNAGMMVPRLLFWLVPGLGQLTLVWLTGATVGEHAVRLRPATPLRHVDGLARVIRWGAGIGGFCLLQLPGNGIISMLGFLFASATFASVLFTRQQRGLVYVAADLELSDDRAHTKDQ